MTALQEPPTFTREAASAERLFLAGDGTLAAHRRAYGDLPGPTGVLRAIEESGLTGRGGSGFPTFRKIAAVKDARRCVVVANGSEGEPASRKDATLLTYAPHLVLDGLEILGDGLGAALHVVATAERVDALRYRIAERGSRITVTEVAERFTAGEESAVVAAINGRPAVPADRLTRVWERGVSGRPTVVLNVETLAQIALIARHGAEWFRGIGDADDPGTFLATIAPPLGSAEWTPQVYELARGARLGGFLDEAGFGRPRAVLVGGFHGTWVAGDAVSQARLSRPGLAPYGAAPGAGVLIPIDRQCGLRETARILDYLAAEVAGQCGPCVNGLPALAHQFRTLAHGRAGASTVQDLGRLSGLVRGRGACSHPDGTARLAASALTVFADDVEHHLSGGCHGG